MEVKIVKPLVWNFSVCGGKDAWKEVVYSARMSGVPPEVSDRDVFRMLVANDYGSALEHVVIKFDIKMSKGNAPEFLEHRMASHSGYSTRYIEVSGGLGKESPAYEAILPIHPLKDAGINRIMKDSIDGSISDYKEILSLSAPREVARYVLPFAQAVGVYHVTMNLRSLLNLLSLRLCVRSSPEFRCIAAQLYFSLQKELLEISGLAGCRGYMRGTCPESGVTGVRAGEQHPFYPVCPFKGPQSGIYVPTTEELRAGISTEKFNKEKAIYTQEKMFAKWAEWSL
jgi:flavin-dependent thymidylate synthase